MTVSPCAEPLTVRTRQVSTADRAFIAESIRAELDGEDDDDDKACLGDTAILHCRLLPLPVIPVGFTQ